MFERLFASRNKPCFAKSSHWDHLRLDLSGNTLEITLPPQDYEFPEKKRGERFNIFDETMYHYDDEPDANGFPPHKEGTTVPSILTRKWDTYGPVWCSQRIGMLQCSAVVGDIAHMEPKLNCFHRGQMERLLMHALYYSRGPGFGRNEYSVPINWHIETLHGVQWLFCESWARATEWVKHTHVQHEGNFTVWLATPLYEDKYLLVTFTSVGSLPADASNRLMFKRINQILPSIKLSLSPEAEKQKVETEIRFPDARYSEKRDPEPWRHYGSYRDGDILKGEDDIVFEGECTPPPKLY